MLLNAAVVTAFLATIIVAQKDNTEGIGFNPPKRARPAACNSGQAPAGAKPPPETAKMDYPTMMCANHPLDASNVRGKQTEDCWGPVNGKGPDEACVKDNSGGSGLFKSTMTTEPSLANHTLYVPASPPPESEKLPLLVWANGACLSQGELG
jgi:hypothetical protein